LRQRRGHPVNPLAHLLQRLVLAGVGTLVLLNLAIAAAGRDGTVQYQVATIGSAIWVVFFASLLMLGPFLSRSRQVLREFMLLAGVATVVASLDLLFLTILALQPLTSLALAVGLSLAVYALARPWIQGQLAGSGALSAERMFDSLYRAARELEQSPGQAGRQLSALLCEVFDPLEAAPTAKAVSRVRVAIDGATMVVPIPRLPGTEPGAIVLRYARRGRRLFTQQDRDLCEQLLEQLRRAVAYDRAVEHGRTEERTRIAQDLHDDIGARLLTLMYKAPNAEIEEYIRHTLQDLKTLTRGLAASSHRLSHAAAEWKADIAQRLSAAGCDLQWSFSADRDLTLTVVQWSALTRVLRELVNNILTHAQATQVEIVLQFDRDHLTLSVSDDGNGRAPETWSHGLGLGGVRKRVKLLGGQVRWVEREDRGIRCEVHAPLSGDSP
jgi:signal transduction histidine kinase